MSLDRCPVIFIATANDRLDAARYLRNLSDEQRQIRRALENAEKVGWCNFVERANATIDDILSVFRDRRYRDRIAVFHFAGHADDYQLLFETAEGNKHAADGRGFADFLAQQKGLQLVFLNGCSTSPQVDELLKANVASVIATSKAINDDAAKDFAVNYYRSIADGSSIKRAYNEAEGAVKAARGNSPRNMYLVSQDEPPVNWPWKLYFNKDAEEVTDWNLPQCVDDYLWNLPLPKLDLPPQPFRHLNWFERADAEIFFGRGRQIRQLYDCVNSEGDAPIILLYGQSGVGKSSLLAAGLLPRLEASHDIRYLRRQQEVGLLDTCKNNLATTNKNALLKQAWLETEVRENKPVVLLLDQVEEVFTRPNKELTNELDDLLLELKAVFAEMPEHPRGKIILTFRKEWLPEIEQKLIEHGLPQSKIFIERLDEKGALEAIKGITRTKRLRSQYKLEIEDGLPENIVLELMEDKGSPLATTLQILLSKMWEEATAENRGRPKFETALYQNLKIQGLLLGDFLDQQLVKLCHDATGQSSALPPEVIDSGLTLDVLAFHTTELGTAEQRSTTELNQEYRHQQPVLKMLIQKLKDRYLLTDPPHDRQAEANATRLAHDTLAPLIRARFDKSILPGQRARRILENRSEDWRDGQTGMPLDERDFSAVQKGLSGMRAATKDEQRIIEASQIERTRRERRKLSLQIVGSITIILIMLSAGFAWWQRGIAIDSANVAKSRELAATSQEVSLVNDLKEDLAILLALKANEFARTPEAEEALRRQLIVRFTNINKTIFSKDGNFLIAAEASYFQELSYSPQNKLFTWDTVSGKLDEQTIDFAPKKELIGECAPDRDGILCQTTDLSRKVSLWNLQTGAPPVFKFQIPESVVNAYLSPDGRLIVTIHADGYVKLWSTLDPGKFIRSQLNLSSLGVDLKDNRFLRELLTINFSANQKYILLQYKNNIVLMETQTGKSFHSFSNIPWLPRIKPVFSPDGKYLLTPDFEDLKEESTKASYQLLLWDIDHLDKPVLAIKPPENAVAFYDFAIFNPDSNFVLAGTGGGRVSLNEVASGKSISHWSISPKQENILSAVFSPNGKSILLSLDKIDGNVLVPCKPCGFTVDDLISLAHQRVTRPLTDEEKMQYEIP